MGLCSISCTRRCDTRSAGLPPAPSKKEGSYLSPSISLTISLPLRNLCARVRGPLKSLILGESGGIGHPQLAWRVLCASIAERERKGCEKGRKTDRRMIDIQRRNKTIRQRYYELLKQGHPVMMAYAMTGREFYLSEKRIRDIIAGRK